MASRSMGISDPSAPGARSPASAQARWRAAARAVRIARSVPDNLKVGVDNPRPLRREDQPVLCRVGRSLRLPDQPREGTVASRQGPGRVADALLSGTVSGAAGNSGHCRRCRTRRHAGRPQPRAAAVPTAGGRRPGRGIRCGGEGRATVLTTEPFVPATRATAKIGPDIHAQVDKVARQKRLGAPKLGMCRPTFGVMNYGDLLQLGRRAAPHCPRGSSRVPHYLWRKDFEL